MGEDWGENAEMFGEANADAAYSLAIDIVYLLLIGLVIACVGHAFWKFMDRCCKTEPEPEPRSEIQQFVGEMRESLEKSSGIRLGGEFEYKLAMAKYKRKLAEDAKAKEAEARDPRFGGKQA